MAAPKWSSLAFFLLLITITAFQSLCFAHKDHQKDQMINPKDFSMEGSIEGSLPGPPGHSPGFSIGARVGFSDDFSNGVDAGSTGSCDGGINGVVWGSVPLFCKPLPAECHNNDNCGPGIRLYFDNTKSRPTSSASSKSNVDRHNKNGTPMMTNDKSFHTDKNKMMKRPTQDGRNMGTEGQRGYNGQGNMMMPGAMVPGYN